MTLGMKFMLTTMCSASIKNISTEPLREQLDYPSSSSETEIWSQGSDLENEDQGSLHSEGFDETDTGSSEASVGSSHEFKRRLRKRVRMRSNSCRTSLRLQKLPRKDFNENQSSDTTNLSSLSHNGIENSEPAVEEISTEKEVKDKCLPSLDKRPVLPIEEAPLPTVEEKPLIIDEEKKLSPSVDSYKRPRGRPSKRKRNNEAFILKKFRNVEIQASDLDLYKLALKQSSMKIRYSKSGLNKKVVLGKHEVDILYRSNYPEHLRCLETLYICELCLNAFQTQTTLNKHVPQCSLSCPPGDEIYRNQSLSIFEVDGKRSAAYCQNLCLLSKLFLDHKTLYFDVIPFLFYILLSHDESGFHPIGYFSKEKGNFTTQNVCCILTLPQYQRKGYGNFLIDFSYLLTRKEGKRGSPEKPLSQLGELSYVKYWKHVILDYLVKHKGDSITIEEIGKETGMTPDDIVNTLLKLGFLKFIKAKPSIMKNKAILEEHVEKLKSRKNILKIDSSLLRWQPYHSRNSVITKTN